MLAAVSATAQLSLWPADLFLLVGPPWIGAAPWAGGEMVAGPSRRQDESFAAAVIAAYGAGLIAACSCAHPLCEALASGAAATVAYLCVRGGVRARPGEGNARVWIR